MPSELTVELWGVRVFLVCCVLFLVHLTIWVLRDFSARSQEQREEARDHDRQG